ncbi:Methylthioribulose-1-phosphate dehydratase [uncultured Flavonifractor sp.]|nr:Methylthioribulose-1-phosphate dehydratase [uncultured Flavonifractor sp.]
MEQDRETLCQVCLLLYQRGYVVSNDGNVSVRIGEDQVLITPSGVSKGRLTPDMLVVCDLEGRVLAGHLHPSSESAMHLLVYRERPDVGAVVHAHPPAATAFSICRRPLAQHYLTETISGLGEVPVAPFALPSTSQVPDSLRPYVAGCNGALLANHGAIAWGRDLWNAFDRMEQVEQTAKIFALVHQLGGGVELSPEQVEAIRGLEGHYRTLSGSRTPHEEQGGGRT